MLVRLELCAIENLRLLVGSHLRGTERNGGKGLTALYVSLTQVETMFRYLLNAIPLENTLLECVWGMSGLMLADIFT